MDGSGEGFQVQQDESVLDTLGVVHHLNNRVICTVWMVYQHPNIHTYVRTYVCMHLCHYRVDLHWTYTVGMHTQVDQNPNIYVHMYICTYVCTYIRMYICITVCTCLYYVCHHANCS